MKKERMKKMNKCPFYKSCDDYQAGSKTCNHKAGKHCKTYRRKKKNRKDIEKEVKLLNMCIGELDNLELANESYQRLEKLAEEEIQVKTTNLIDALYGRFEKKLNKKTVRDMN